VYRTLIFAGFVSAPEEGVDKAKRSRIVRALSIVLALVAYWITYVVPVTFMIAMSWGCESDTRTLGQWSMLYYGDQRIGREPGLRPGRLKTRSTTHTSSRSADSSGSRSSSPSPHARRNTEHEPEGLVRPKTTRPAENLPAAR
jgi:hypothetical protein